MKSAVQRTIHLPAIVFSRLNVSFVVENTEVLQIHVPNTLRLYKEYRKIKCYNKMKLFSIICQSWKTAKSNFGEIVDNYNLDVLCLTETFETVKEPISFRQWSKISKPRKDCYGGVAILYKDSDNGVILERKGDSEDENVEVLCAKVTVSKDFYFLLVVSYIPPEKKTNKKVY